MEAGGRRILVRGHLGKCEPSLKSKLKGKEQGGGAQVMEPLPSKHEARSSKPSITENKSKYCKINKQVIKLKYETRILASLR
jgi:hypothetical protein